jgi:hypothetical protein
MNLTLSQRDIFLFEIEKQIKNKKNMILNKRKEIKKKQKINFFLDNVKNDYQRYFEYILREKQQQYYAMELLNKYIEDLIKTNKLAENDLQKAKHDQREILSEIGKIKKEIDEII